MSTQIKCDIKEAYNKYANRREKNEMQDWKVKPRQKFLELIKEEGKKTILK